MRRLALKLFAVTTLVLPYTASFGQGLNNLQNESKIPPRIKASELPDDMKAYKITTEKGGGDLMSMMMSPLMMLGTVFSASSSGGEQNSAENLAAAHFIDLVSLSWTTGATYNLYGQEYLVTYAPQFDFNAIAHTKAPPDISRMDLVLTLVNTKSISTITPRPDVTKAEWNKSMTPEPGSAGDLAAKKSATQSNLKQLTLGMIMYSNDYDDEMPYVQSTKAAYEVTSPYVKNRAITKSLNPNGGDFQLNMAVAGVNTTLIKEPASTPLYYEATAWPDATRCVAFVDGHVKFVAPDEWNRLQPYLFMKLKRTGKPLPATLGANWKSG